MTHDYKNNVVKKSSVGKDDYGGMIAPFLAGLLIGLFVAFIVYLNVHDSGNTEVASPELVIENKPEKTAVAESEPELDEPLPEPQFDFYQILPNMEVNVSEWETDTQKESVELEDKSGVYILQVGSFEQHEAADELKAKLALLGIHAEIQRVVINGRDIRHRVRVGPYKDLEKLQETRDRLLANNLDYMLLKLKLDDI